jgi:radical SAM superfamily enzyme YgiQ (UPF0313 family)
MKKILLVNSNTEGSPYPVSPLGLCMVATAAETAGYEVKVFDGLWDNKKPEEQESSPSLTDVLHDFQPDVIGVSIRNIDDIVMEQSIYYVDEIERLCIQPIKKYGKGITVLGGAGYSLFPEELLERWQFDFGIVGPGEKTFVTLLKVLENRGLPDKIQGVLARNPDNGISGSTDLHFPEKRSKLSLPNSRIDTHLNYQPYLTRGAYPIQTKRGCALHCIYCSYPVLEGKTYQLRTAKDVVDEMQGVLERIPTVVFEFVDSTFNHPPQHAENICRELISRKLSLRMRTMGVNPSGVTPELIDLMRKAGFKQIDCTPDSASDTMLKNLRKGFTRKKLEETAGLLKAAHMPTMWFFVLGGPGETEETLDETFDFIHRFIDERDLVYLTEGLRIYPKTGLAKTARQEGVIKNDESLLTPHFYVSQKLGQEGLSARVKAFTAAHHNCLRSVESTPSPGMIQKAIEIRQKEGLTDEPMFRTLLRVRKEGFLSIGFPEFSEQDF